MELLVATSVEVSACRRDASAQQTSQRGQQKQSEDHKRLPLSGSKLAMEAVVSPRNNTMFCRQEGKLMEDIREHYLSWLRDAHAMEEQALTMMNGMLSRLENYPVLRARLEQHIKETERQAAALSQLLEARDSGTSTVKDTLGKATALGQAMGGMFADDEVVKGTMASYTFEHMEVAAYKVLISAAAVLEDTAAIGVFEQNLAEEQDMADWLFDHMDQTTRIFLARDEAGLPARR
jgi:ferritin-like metal-binding protein YciE